MRNEITIEIAPFVKADGITEEVLLTASEKLENELLTKAKGYLGRALVRDSVGKYADIVFWKSEKDATAAMEILQSSSICRSYFECMKEEDHNNTQNGVSLFNVAETYGFLNHSL